MGLLRLQSSDSSCSSYLSRFHAQQSDTDIGGGARPMADVETKPSNSFAMITYSRTISASMVNELRVNATRFSFNEIQSSSQTNFGLPRIEIEDLPLPSRIKFRPNLTVNVGLRWESFSPLAEKEGHLSNLVLGPNGLADARIVVVNSLFPPDRNNFAPRLGFAWRPKKLISLVTENKLVLRGG